MANSHPVEFVVSDTGCHLVTSHKLNQDGYFRKMFKDGKARMYHRVVYEETYGKSLKAMK